MKIIIETIPHKEQRYDTVGDFFVDGDGTTQIRVSNMGNARYALMVAIHELVELALCEARGITTIAIDQFDIAFEAHRENYAAEPGDDPNAPYQNEHCFATGIERLLCAALGIKWADYDKACHCVS